ncbi:hypothetical protein GGI12_004106, partial [Dipsacomyces acuminosporus]
MITVMHTSAVLGIGFALWAGLLVLIIRLRNINSSFNEFRESLSIFAIVAAIIIEIVVLTAVQPMFLLNRTYRFITTAFDVVGANAITLLILAYPVYMCVFNHHDYEIEWRLKLSKDQLEDEYGLPPTNYTTAEIEIRPNSTINTQAASKV